MFIVEDCAEAIGSLYKGKHVGQFGDAATYSFFGNKTISTGEGGMVLFKDKKIYKFASLLRDHGMSKKKKYWHDFIGYNYRLTNLQAAVGVAQMERFEFIIDKKRDIASKYRKILSKTKKILSLPSDKENCINSFWLYTILLDPMINRDKVMEKLINVGVETRPVFYPLHKMDPYKTFETSKHLVNTNFISKQGLCLPSSVSLKNNEIEYICNELINVIC